MFPGTEMKMGLGGYLDLRSNGRGVGTPSAYLLTLDERSLG